MSNDQRPIPRHISPPTASNATDVSNPESTTGQEDQLPPSPGAHITLIPELLEQILLPLPPQDLILRLPRVSPALRSLILTSPALRRKAFLLPNRTVPTSRPFPIPIATRKGINLHLHLPTQEAGMQIAYLWCGIEWGDPSHDMRRGLSPYLLCQPPVRRARVEVRLKTYETGVERRGIEYDGSGMRFGDLFHAVTRVQAGVERGGGEVRRGGLVTVTVWPFGDEVGFRRRLRERKREFERGDGEGGDGGVKKGVCRRRGSW